MLIAIAFTVQLLSTYTTTFTNFKIGIIGGGSSFINPQMQTWIQLYMRNNSNVVIIYQSIGSGAGVSGWIEGILNFAVSDIPLPKNVYNKVLNRGIKPIQIPIILGAIAIVYNIPEWNETLCGPLRLSGNVLAKIYLGKIVKWNHPEIKRLQVDKCKNLLPNKEIIAIHRSDASGTTAVFTLYLSLKSKEWKEKYGWGYIPREWPRDKIGFGIGAKGNEGITAEIKRTPYSLGYVEVNYAIREKLKVAAILNREGYFTLPKPENVIEAGKYAIVKGLPKPIDFWNESAVAIFLDREGRNTYPIVTSTYLIISNKWSSNVKKNLMVSFIKWICTIGQNYVIEGYVSIPKELQEYCLNALNYIE